LTGRRNEPEEQEEAPNEENQEVEDQEPDPVIYQPDQEEVPELEQEEVPDPEQEVPDQKKKNPMKNPKKNPKKQDRGEQLSSRAAQMDKIEQKHVILHQKNRNDDRYIAYGDDISIVAARTIDFIYDQVSQRGGIICPTVHSSARTKEVRKKRHGNSNSRIRSTATTQLFQFDCCFENTIIRKEISYGISILYDFALILHLNQVTIDEVVAVCHVLVAH
jgi:hypothetical protein